MVEKKSQQPDHSRRKLLKLLVGVPVAGAAATPLLAAANYVYPPASLTTPPAPMAVAGVGELQVGEVKQFVYNKIPAALVRLDEKEYRAFYRRCPHLGCTASWEPENKRFFCPCHNGVFDIEGKNIAGPPPSPLRPLLVLQENNKIMVQERGA